MFLNNHVAGCKNFGPFCGPLNIRCRIILRTQKGTIILTTPHARDSCERQATNSRNTFSWVPSAQTSPVLRLGSLPSAIPSSGLLHVVWGSVLFLATAIKGMYPISQTRLGRPDKGAAGSRRDLQVRKSESLGSVSLLRVLED